MVSAHQFIDLALACVLLIVVPGPAVMFVVGRALTYGRRSAMASVVGNSTGCYAGAACIAFGLGPVLQRSDALFSALKWAGAAYLVWLGVRALRDAHALDSGATAVEAAAGPRLTAARAFRTGVVVGITNPKTLIVFAAIVPQFVEPGAGPFATQMLLLSIAPIAVGLVTDTAWAAAAGQARSWLSGSPRRMATLGRVGGISVIGLGISIAVSGRRD